jgi:hypothetical protein
MFANQYFLRSNNFRPYISDRVNENTSMIVVIPCLMEPDIVNTLQSLLECNPPKGCTEIIIFINESESCLPEVSVFNRQTSLSIQEWMKENSSDWLRFFPVGPVKLPAKWAGAGLARKAGMDEALYRYNCLKKPDGIIVSLDADTLVEKNYLQSIEDHFLNHPGDVGATIRFRHQTDGLPERHAEGIRLYEMYMYYYKEASIYAGYPHALYTIGSAFAVKADAYMKRGGMNRRKAGEDFYFLQTLTQTGHVGEIGSTCIHPSARISQRVPFGTGTVLEKWMNGSDELSYAFNLQAFSDLKHFFSRRKEMFRVQADFFEQSSQSWSDAIRTFISEEGLDRDFQQLSSNCSRLEIFSDRFFQIFNAFRILKFLNFSHPRFYNKERLDLCVSKLELELKPDSV